MQRISTFTKHASFQVDSFVDATFGKSFVVMQNADQPNNPGSYTRVAATFPICCGKVWCTNILSHFYQPMGCCYYGLVAVVTITLKQWK